MKKSATKPRNTTGRDPAATLSPEALTWRQHLLDEFEIADSAGLLLLDTAMAAFDRMREAQRIVAAEGSMQKDRFGAVRAHPALAVERDSRAGMLAALRALRLDLEPLQAIGRPPGR